MKLAVGQARFTSEITGETKELTFGALHLGDHNVTCGIHPFDDEARYETLVREMSAAFSGGDIPEVIRLMDKDLGSAYSLKNLFSDDRRAILRRILDASLGEAEEDYRHIYEQNALIVRFLRDARVPVPRAIRTAAEFALNSRLRRVFADPNLDAGQVRTLLDEARASDIALDSTMLEYALRLTIESLFERFEREIHNLELIERLEDIVDMARALPFEVVLWTAQNVWFQTRQSVLADNGGGEAEAWHRHFLALGEKLGFNVAEDAKARAQGG